jgi:hypothetical protein
VIICPLFPRSELSSTHHAIMACTIEIEQQHSGQGNNVLLVRKHGVHVLERLLHLFGTSPRAITESQVCYESRGSWKFHACGSYLHCDEVFSISIAHVSYAAIQPTSEI